MNNDVAQAGHKYLYCDFPLDMERGKDHKTCDKPGKHTPSKAMVRCKEHMERLPIWPG